MSSIKDYETKVLLSTIAVLAIKIETNHLQRVVMSWINGGGQLPRTCKEYTEILKKYQNKTMMRILSKRDEYNTVYFSHPRFTDGKKQAPKEKEGEVAEKIRDDRALLLDGAPPKQKREFSYFNRINLMRAETFVIKQIIECRLIKYAVQMIESEHSALEVAFEQAASEATVQAYVHPQQ